MKKTVSLWQMVGFVFTAVAGTLLHFLFAWSGENVAVALFSAVNESIWEHLKLLFYPMLIFAAVEYFTWGKEEDSFWCTKLIGILTGFGLILAVYYTYTGALGIKADWFNITLFFLAAGVVYWLESKLFQRGISCPSGGRLAFALILLTVAAFVLLTFAPLHIPLFEDPLTGTYGFQK